MAYESSAPVIRTPLASLSGYSSPLITPKSFSNEDPERHGTVVGEWRSSPRWSAILGDGCIEVEPAEGKSSQVRVENCPTDDVPASRDEAFGIPPE
jgi:hypothetical protein